MTKIGWLRARLYLLAAAPDLLAVVESVEWDADDRCPLCTRLKWDWHAPGCKLEAALRKVRK